MTLKLERKIVPPRAPYPTLPLPYPTLPCHAASTRGVRHYDMVDTSGTEVLSTTRLHQAINRHLLLPILSPGPVSVHVTFRYPFPTLLFPDLTHLTLTWNLPHPYLALPDHTLPTYQYSFLDFFVRFSFLQLYWFRVCTACVCDALVLVSSHS